MKKVLALLLSLALCMTAFAALAEDMRVAMITDYGDITDQSFNQTTYEAAKAYCEANGVDFTYYKPAGDSTAERVAMVEKAVDEDYNVLVLPGFAFGATVAEVQAEYPDTKFIALDVSAFDLKKENEDTPVDPASNVYCAVYQEELCGYMAGYAAVKLGYTHLGFLGGMAVPAVVRYGFGFVQGADAAAVELGKGGGGIYSSAAEAAAKVEGAKVIGVDVDQAAIIDGQYGEGLTVTSAMKGLAATVNTMLAEIAAGNWANYGGQVANLGLVGEDPAANYVQIAPSTQYADGFTADDYAALVSKMFNGEITVSNAIEAMPATTVTVNDRGAVK